MKTVENTATCLRAERWVFFAKIEGYHDVMCRQCRMVIARANDTESFPLWKHLEEAHEDLLLKRELYHGEPAKLSIEEVSIALTWT